MAFNQTTQSNALSGDDYMNDIKLDSSVTLPESASHLKWISNNLPIFSATFWDKSLRIF